MGKGTFRIKKWVTGISFVGVTFLATLPVQARVSDEPPVFCVDKIEANMNTINFSGTVTSENDFLISAQLIQGVVAAVMWELHDYSGLSLNALLAIGRDAMDTNLADFPLERKDDKFTFSYRFPDIRELKSACDGYEKYIDNSVNCTGLDSMKMPTLLQSYAAGFRTGGKK